MHILLRDDNGFEICTANIDNTTSVEYPLSAPRVQRGPQVDYSQWKHFVEGRQVNLGRLNKNIIDSWRRCMEMSIDPSPRSCWDFTPMTELEPFTSTLRKICGEVESSAYEAIRGTGLLMTFTNAKGRVARTCGDLEILRQADKLNFGPGANWSEDSVGTNAIGTALNTGCPMQVFGEEHFCRSHHSWSCTAAPIIDPHGSIWGCFDISGPKSSDHTKSLKIVLQATRALEQQLCRLYCSELEGQLGSLFSSMFNSVMTGILSLDKSGIIISANSAADVLLGNTWGTLQGRKAEEFFDYDKFLTETKTTSKREPIVMRCRINPDLFVRALNVFSPTGTRIDTIVSICEKQTSHQFAVSAKKDPLNTEPKLEKYPEGFEHILHSSRPMRQAISQASRAARTPSTVILYGESGTGKELFARGIHQAGPRSKNPFVAVNCGSFSEELVQSELFGYSGGSFTGAAKKGRIGKFQMADKGVLFLDEISEMPLSQQVNLLRALEERTIVPVGGTTPHPVDVKIIAATNKDLPELVKQGLFREDLFYRLNVVGVDLPPLRERGNDTILLAEYHLDRLCKEFGIPCEGMLPDVNEVLMAYNWPGNVRELVNCVEYAVNNLSGVWLKKEHLPPYLIEKITNQPIGGSPSLNSGFQLKKREEDAIREALDFHKGNISKTAKALGIGRNTLYSKMERLNIQI
ncbi:sigma-54-dependent Fis family transcriptional regulator [Desulfovibrio sp. UCD-KL4C]|uniref:sigma-54-dependent Fis family transcriptional regulator n=1 Tax=Desulfovibrio sp. UCD-KL4C TaxID=2578120 RepID=UPI0025BA7896|nr:sigma-54-dependent Fis family transcriptional regulator [Desulfovibrio sp. UCD-KL4C]